MRTYFLLYTLVLLTALSTHALTELFNVDHGSGGLRLDDLKPHLPYIDDSGSKADTPPTNSTAEDNFYYDARCRGRNLMKAMTLDEAEPSALLRWPYTHSL
jgi:hypothetical protein